MSHIHVTSCHKYLIYITHVTNIVMLLKTDIRYSCHSVMSCHVISCTKVWYLVLTSYIHDMSQMTDIQNSCIKTCNVMSQIYDIQSSSHKFISCLDTNDSYSVIMSNRRVISFHKYLIFSTHVTQSCYVTNGWYSINLSHSHDMSQMSVIDYTCHGDISCHATNVWYSILMSYSHVMSQIFGNQY